MFSTSDSRTILTYPNLYRRVLDIANLSLRAARALLSTLPSVLKLIFRCQRFRR